MVRADGQFIDACRRGCRASAADERADATPAPPPRARESGVPRGRLTRARTPPVRDTPASPRRCLTPSRVASGPSARANPGWRGLAASCCSWRNTGRGREARALGAGGLRPRSKRPRKPATLLHEDPCSGRRVSEIVSRRSRVLAPHGGQRCRTNEARSPQPASSRRPSPSWSTS